jgi:hypothetical protein
MREAGGGGLAQQGGDDAPDARQVVASGGAGPMAVGAAWQRPALLVLAVLVLALVVALASAGPPGAGTLAALLVTLGAPVLTPVLAAAVLASPFLAARWGLAMAQRRDGATSSSSTSTTERLSPSGVSQLRLLAGR